MRLSLDTREVGRVTVVRCNGRIIAGTESELLRAHVTHLLRDRRAIILHLGEVGFIDSSGLGTMVRSLTSTRQVRGDLKLCDVPEHVRKVLEMSHLAQLFDAHESEEKAIAAFYTRSAPTETPLSKGHSILCLDTNTDILAYVRELLRSGGYEVHTTSRIGDARILMRVTRFDLLLLAASLSSAPPAQHLLQTWGHKSPVLEIGNEFSTSHAGEAGAELLARIEALLNAKSA